MSKTALGRFAVVVSEKATETGFAGDFTGGFREGNRLAGSNWDVRCPQSRDGRERTVRRQFNVWLRCSWKSHVGKR
jgi:hypothetical protein